MHKITRSSVAVVALVIGIGCASAQVTTGIQPLGSYGGGPDAVNLANLNVHLDIPIVAKPGRGLNFTYALGYDAAVWAPSSANAWAPVYNFGWTAETQGQTGYVTATTNLWKCFSGGSWYWVTTYARWIYIDKRGTPHPFSLPTVAICPGSIFPTSATGTATDGSGYQITAYPGSAVLEDVGGHTLHPPFQVGTGSGTAEDTNGNEITFNGTTYTDTLNQAALTISGTNPVNFQYTGPSGAEQYVVSYTSYTVRTNFGCSGISEYGPYSVSLVNKITLADNSYYQFTYEGTPGYSGDVTGRIASVRLPTGGTISYTYSGGSSGAITCADGSTPTLKRTTPDGLWQYAHSESGTAWTTVITDPLNDSTTINFQDVLNNTTTYFSRSEYETERQIHDNSTPGNLLETVLTCYNGSAAPCNSTAVTIPLSEQTVYFQWPGNEESKTDTAYNTYGLPTTVKQYDYGSGSPGAILRETTTVYAGLTNDIQDRPSSVTVTNGSTTVALTTYTYDVGTPTATSTPQHVGVTGSRGNVTTVATQANSGTTLYRQFAYYDTGMLNTSTGASTSSTTNGPTTTYNYTAGAASCYNSFVTSISEPLSLSRSFTYDSTCAGGAMTQLTDENSKSTNYSYDLMWRPNQAGYPDGGQTNATYNIIGTGSNIQTTAKIVGSTNLTGDTVLDGLGRPLHQELTSDPNGTTYVDTTYDALGRVASVSNPHHTGSSSTDGITTYSYDALNRTTQIQRQDTSSVVSISYTQRATKVQDEGNGASRVTKIYQTDGLGRLVSTCEVTSVTQLGISPTPVACNLDSAGTGFLTSYGYDALGNLTSVSQGGLNPRTYAYDMLSRLTNETDPEVNGNTKVYAYDTCSAGDLCTRTAPKPNQTGSATVVTTYAYDALHRLTEKSYSDSTPTAYYYYDQNSCSNNYKGRLTSEGTYNGAWLTAQSLCYDSMGRIATSDQYTPLNIGSSAFWINYYYDLFGDLTSAQDGVEGVTYTYSYDAAARLTKLQSTYSDAYHPGTLFTVNTYNPLSEIQQATLGNGIVRNLTYDDRGRLTSQTDSSIYSFTFPTSGGLAPDSNILKANDSINGNWTYSYDDFSRVATSSKTGQAFSYLYDRFGNRLQQNVTTGTGPSPQYIFDANNHLPGYSYDAAGNLLNDGYHSYTFDAEGRVTAVDGGGTASYVYDAEGRVVRRSLGTTTLDFVLGLNGKAITELSGGTWDRSELYAAGTHVATYADGITYFFHPDWLGSVRAETKYDGTLAGSMTNLAFGDGQVWTGRLPSWQNFAWGDIDIGSSLDLFMFRQYSNVQGRWIMPDPAGMGAVDPANPQTWNRYAYVANNPLSAVDPLGLMMKVCGCNGEGGGMLDIYSGSSSNVNLTLSGFPVDPGLAYQYEQTVSTGDATLAAPGFTLGPGFTLSGITVTAFAFSGSIFMGGSTTSSYDSLFSNSFLFMSAGGGGGGGGGGGVGANNGTQPPGVPKPPNPILQYDKCVTQNVNPAKNNAQKVSIINGVTNLNGLGLCAFTGPDAPLCVGVLGGVATVNSLVFWAGGQITVYDAETQCLQQN